VLLRSSTLSYSCHRRSNSSSYKTLTTATRRRVATLLITSRAREQDAELLHGHKVSTIRPRTIVWLCSTKVQSGSVQLQARNSRSLASSSRMKELSRRPILFSRIELSP
jgi:hypothetical protein